MVKWDDMNLHQRINFRGLISTDPMFSKIYALVSVGGWRYAAGVLYIGVKNNNTSMLS